MKKLLAFLLSMAVVVTMILAFSVVASAAVNSDTSWYYGSESETSFVLYDTADLEELADIVNNGTKFYGKTIRLADTFCDTNALTTTIGKSEANCFSGTFDGNGKTVVLNISGISDSYTGMFSYLYGGTVKNIITTGTVATYTGNAKSVGGIVGIAGENSSVINCASAAKVIGEGRVGGIVGDGSYTTAKIENCYSVGNLETGKDEYKGGIVGYNSSPVTNCYWLSSISNVCCSKGYDKIINCVAMSEAQMKAAPNASDEAWTAVTVGEQSLGKVSLVDALNNYVNNNSGNGYLNWKVETGNSPVHLQAKPVFDDRFGGTVTKDNYNTAYTADTNPYKDSKGYTFAGWSTVIDDADSIITGEPENGQTYYAVWKNDDTGNVVVTQPLNFDSGLDSTAFASGTNLASATGISWNSSSNTLTLNGAIIDVYGNEKAESSADTQAAILLPDGATLVAADNTENTVNLNSTTTDEYAFAIEGKGTLAISGKGILNVNAKKASDESNVRVYGISTSGKLSISDLTLNVFGLDRAIYKGDANQDNIEISGGTINAKCNTADGDVTVEDNGKYAIHAEDGNIVISNGTVNANGGAIGIIASKGKVAVSGGTVTVDSGTQGLYAKTSVDITGGTVKATAHGYVENQTGKSAKAIYSQGTIGISGTANVSATCINDKGVDAEGAKFYGIRAKDNITITGNNAVITAKGTTAAFNLETGKTVTATNAVIRAGEDEANASVQTGDVTNAVTGAKYAKVSFEPVFDDRFGGTGLTKNSYTKDAVPTQDCHAKTQGYTFAGWSTAIDDAGNIISTEPENGKTYYAVWKKNGKTVITQTLHFDGLSSDKQGDGYEWDNNGNKLTLSGLTVDIYASDSDICSGIVLPKDASVKLTENTDNSVAVENAGSGNTYGVHSLGSLNIGGSGLLKIESSAAGGTSYGLSTNGGGIDIEEATIEVSAGDYSIFSSNVTASEDAISISNAAKVTSTAGTKGYALGAYSGNLTIEGENTVVTAKGGKMSISAGTTSNEGNLVIKDKAAVKVENGVAGATAVFANKDISVTGESDLTVTMKQQTSELAHAVYAKTGKIEIDNSKVKVEFENGNTYTETQFGIFDDGGNLEIKGDKSNVTVKGGSNGITSGHSEIDGTLKISGGEVAADCGVSALWAGSAMEFSGGTISATAHGLKDGNAKAIYSQGDISISNKAEVTATCVADTTPVESTTTAYYGIRAKGDITVTSPEKLIVKGTTAAFILKSDGKNLISDIDLIAYTNVEGTEGKTTLTPAVDTKVINLNGDTYKCVRTKEAEPTPTPATQYTVTFDNQGHGVVPQSQAIEEGGKVSDPGSLEAEGFIFGGWFTDKECTDAWDFDNDTVTKDITLYAKWTEEPQPAEAKEALMATGTAKKTTNTIKWNAVADADGYDVYYAKCGNNLKKVKSTTALKYTKKGLNKKKYYKYRVKAYETVDGNKVYLAASPVIHIAGVSAKYSNATKVTADPDGMNIEAGDTDVIKAKITKKSNKKTVLWKNHVSAKIRYMSTDSSVVTVDSKGNVTAIDKGEAYVYAYAASGAFAKITVTVQ